MALNLTIGWALLIFILACIDGYRLWRHFGRGAPTSRWLLSLLPLTGAIMLLMIWLRVGKSPYDEWNGARTAPAVAWARGMPLYYSKGQGPAPAFIHGPVTAIVRLPATLAQSPTGAILIADTINAALFYLPAVAFLMALGSKRRLMPAMGLLVFVGFSLNLPSLLYSAFQVHADAPAVGFGLLACLFAIRASRDRQRVIMIALAALCAVLSVASKQNMMPILLVLPAYLFVRHGTRLALILAVAEAILLLLITVLSIAAFGYEPLGYTMFVIVARHMEWFESYGPPLGWAFGLSALISDIAAPTIGLGMAMLFDAARRTSPGSTMRRRLVRNPWFLPLLVAAVMVPSSVIGRIKPGGAENALTPTSYFLVAALATWIACIRPRRGTSMQNPILRIAVGMSASLCLALGILCVNPLPQPITYWQEVAALWRNPEQVAYEFDLKHPNKVYFPWNPLSTLMADGRYYPFDYGVVDLRLAGEFMSRERLQENLPEDFEYVIYPPHPESLAMLGLLPAYSKPENLPDLPGWLVYARSKAGQD